MNEEELKQQIAELILKDFNKNYKFIDLAGEILTLFRDAGHEPPESVREMVEKSYADGVDDIEQKYKGYMSPEGITIECPKCHREGLLSDYIIYDKFKEAE